MTGSRAASSLFIIGGTTASGKSAAALALAARIEGVIVNADSVQLYRDLPTLTARPGARDEAAIPHRLYGILDAATPASAALWLERAQAVIGEVGRSGRPPILVGGTGLYLQALLRGLVAVPAIDPGVRAAVRALPGAEVHGFLRREDPVMATRLAPGDRQRCMRALEVVRATGRSLAAWQDEAAARRTGSCEVRGVALLPDRPLLRRRIEARMRGMLDAGALDEVADLRRRHADPLALPIAKAHGLRELLELQDGRCGVEEAVQRTSVRVRQYAKRQATWFRHQLPALQVVEATGEEPSIVDRLLSAYASSC
ncbi:MAG: tRNA (adenosine(37)-N6)-dimethylallyltransferase MiaA [Geminicoccaceae bacterium]|nr:tRNA (adenosine(37)-N6)-dimethylallyltransferase MiaA [Geminicoccaceae bacterium]